MYKVIEPSTSFKFRISQRNVDMAKPKDPCQCVVAQALKEREDILEVNVFSTITTIVWTGATLTRHRTPDNLREGLRNYDETGKWDLPEGDYYLLPVKKGQKLKNQRARANKRRLNGDPNMSKKYPFKGKNRDPINPRMLNLLALRRVSKSK